MTQDDRVELFGVDIPPFWSDEHGTWTEYEGRVRRVLEVDAEVPESRYLETRWRVQPAMPIRMVLTLLPG